MKLYRVTLRGMQNTIGSGMVHGVAYVVAENSDRAHKMVRESLEKEGLGFSSDRELQSVELIADERQYNDTGHRLYVKRKAKNE